MIAAVGTRRRALAGVAAAMGLGLLLAIAGGAATRPGSGETAATPADDTVVAVLGTSGSGYSDRLQALLQAARALPDDATAAKAAARQLIEDGREAGDARLVGVALGVLHPFLDAPDAETLALAATARQYQHDFTGALALLDRALALAPRDADALMARATINVVQGRLDLADGDCRRLHALARPDLGLICQSTARTLTAEAPTVYARLEAILARHDIMLDRSLRRYARGLMGEIAALRGQRELARGHLAAVLAEDPGALRERMMLTDLMLEADEPAAALDLLDGAAPLDAVLVRRAQAAQRLGRTDVLSTTVAELERRFRQNRDLGVDAHAREEARFYLEIDRDPARALGRAEVNWSRQREIEDAQLLIDAAVAAGAPAAAVPVLDWMAEQSVAAPALRVPEAVREATR